MVAAVGIITVDVMVFIVVNTAVLGVVVLALGVGVVDVDVLLLVIKSTLFSGFEAIETLISLNRFKWKSNCASAEMKTFSTF